MEAGEDKEKETNKKMRLRLNFMTHEMETEMKIEQGKFA